MKLIAKIKDLLACMNGDGLITLQTDKYTLERLKTLDTSKEYTVELKELKNKRTLEQNKYMWALLSEISMKVDGTRANDFDYYIECLERADAKSTVVYCLKEAENTLRESFRAIKLLQEVYIHDELFGLYKVFEGSSKMTTKEMTILIDVVKDMACEVGVEEMDYWNEVL